MQLYALLDSKRIEGLSEILESEVLPHRRLKGQDMPILVGLSEVDGLTRQLLTHLEGEVSTWNIACLEPGIFFRSTPDFDAVWKHWSALAGGSASFPFWQPGSMAAYLVNIAEDAASVIRIFGQKTSPVHSIYLIENRLKSWRFTEAKPKLNSKFQRTERSGPLKLNPATRSALKWVQHAREIERIAHRIETTFGNHLDPKRAPGLIEARVEALFQRMIPAGIKQSESLYLLACWEVFYGPNFESKDPEDRLSEICQSNEPEDAKIFLLRKRIEALPATVLAAAPGSDVTIV